MPRVGYHREEGSGHGHHIKTLRTPIITSWTGRGIRERGAGERGRERGRERDKVRERKREKERDKETDKTESERERKRKRVRVRDR